MAKATVALLDFPRSQFFIYVSNGGSRKQMRRALRLACYKRRSLVKFGLPAFVPYLTHQMQKLGLVTVHVGKRPAQSDLTYSIFSGEKGAVMLEISGKEYGQLVSFRGPFFSWIGGQVRLRQERQKLRGTAKQRAQAVTARIEQLRAQQTFRGQKIYTPRQLELQKQFREVFNKHIKQSDRAAARHYRERTARKLPPDFRPEDDLLPKQRIITVNFEQIKDPGYADNQEQSGYDPDDREWDDEVPNN